MQVTETATAGLKREYRVVVPATDLEAKVKERLDDLKGRVQLRGFRPGKVPVAHLKRLYGKSAMAEVIEAAVREANTKIVTDHGFKLATEPKVVLPSEEGAVEGVIAGKSDLAYTVEMEIVPPITLADFKTIKLERLTAPVTDAEIDQALQTIGEQNRPFAAKTEGAEKGDRVTVSFQGTMNGEAFEGGSGEDVPIVLGSGQFIPGFEDHLIGIKAGESRTFDVNFPENYPAPRSWPAKTRPLPLRQRRSRRLARSRWTTPSPRRSDWSRSPSCAMRCASASSASTRRPRGRRSSARSSISLTRSTSSIRRRRWSRRNSTTSGRRSRTISSSRAVPLPMKEPPRRRPGLTIAPSAERRVRLGLVLAEIGEKNNIKVSDEQLSQAVVAQARMIPGQEQRVWDYYRNNPGALAALRAPIFEDKVVDFLLELAEITDKQVSREELFKEDEE